MNRDADNRIQNGEHVLDQLSAYLDGALDQAEQKRVHAHIESCDECRAGYIELSATQQLLRNLPTVAPPRAFTLTPQAAQARTPFVRRLLQPKFSPLLATGSVLSFALLVLVLFSSLVSTPQEAAPSVASAPSSRYAAGTPAPGAVQSNPASGAAGNTDQAATSQALATETPQTMAAAAAPTTAAAAPVPALPTAQAYSSGSSGPTTTSLDQANQAEKAPAEAARVPRPAIVLGIEAVLAVLAVGLAIIAILARRRGI